MRIKKERPNKGFKGKAPIFSDSLKVQIALEYLDGEYSCSQVATRNHLTTKNVEYFVHWYRRHHTVITMPEELPLSEESIIPSGSTKELEKKLALAEMKIAALEKVIALANEAYGTDLKKKAVTR
ncbi:MAG: transposase [Chitinophagaceae bacterium]|nr:transposase [Chitinophagaceae bacterium]